MKARFSSMVRGAGLALLAGALIAPAASNPNAPTTKGVARNPAAPKAAPAPTKSSGGTTTQTKSKTTTNRNNRNSRNNRNRHNNNNDKNKNDGKDSKAGQGLTQTSWFFTEKDAIKGWQGANLSMNVDASGLRITPDGNQPQLSLRGLGLDAGEYSALKVELLVPSPADGMALRFLWTDEPEFAPVQSATVPVAKSSDPQTLTISLKGRPGWRGTITGIRLDPPGNAGRVVIRSVAFE